tara:strand:- start:233 stop:526 length:294 start_codon:yes stop_codon:yes gene_type:complete
MIEYTVNVFENGDRYWYLNGRRHREDGPAIERADGSKQWYLNGERHRENGPAIEYANGDKSWYLNGKKVTKQEVMKSSCSGKIVNIDGKKYRLEEVS